MQTSKSEGEQALGSIRILRREPRTAGSARVVGSDEDGNNPLSSEQREKHYNKTRERIFGVESAVTSLSVADSGVPVISVDKSKARYRSQDNSIADPDYRRDPPPMIHMAPIYFPVISPDGISPGIPVTSPWPLYATNSVPTAVSSSPLYTGQFFPPLTPPTHSCNQSGFPMRPTQPPPQWCPPPPAPPNYMNQFEHFPSMPPPPPPPPAPRGNPSRRQ